MGDLAEHITLILAILGSLATITGLLIWAASRFWFKRILMLEDRQRRLREETLPQEYLRRDDLQEIKNTLIGLRTDYKDFMDTCRKGDCPVGQRLDRTGS